jgi:iron complex outermembrane receptor protein
MRKAAIIITIFLAAISALNAQSSFSGTVKDPEGQPIPGASVRILGTFLATATDANGKYDFKNLNQKEIEVEVSSLGFLAQRDRIILPAGAQKDWKLQPQNYLSNEVEIQATRADDKSAMAFTTLGKEEVKNQNFGQDIPFLLATQPGVVVNSDAGTGIGYTGIRVRGSDPTRINVTVNGIPMNDAESHGLFWVNMPDFASSVSSIQLQRGVGTSTNGAGAFGATLNLQTNSFSGKPYASYTGSAGSFNTLRHSFEAGTGLVNGFTFDVRMSKINSDGFIDRASSDLKSFYLTGAWYGKKSSIRANVFSGREKTYQAWYGVPQDSLATNPTYNPAGVYYDAEGKELFYDNETDNYQQDHYQLFFNHEPRQNLQFNVALHYTRGRGYFEQYRQQDDLSNYGASPLVFGAQTVISGTDTISVPGDTISTTDLIRQRWLDNHFYGTVFSAVWQVNNKWRLIFGGGANRYEGAHFGDVTWAQFGDALPRNTRYYDNDAVKTDVNVYLKSNYEIVSNLNFFADLQYRAVNYDFLGFNDLLQSVQQNVSLNFFNPKAGLTWDVNDRHRFFLSTSVANREPVRDDFTQSSVNSRPLPERLIDTELGYRFKQRVFKAGVTAYFMDYTNQLVLTGQINDVGAYNRVNIANSYRAGAEFEWEWQVMSKLAFSGNFVYSVNKIDAFTEFVDDYDTGLQQQIQYSNTNIAFSPNVTSAATISWKPFSFLRFDLVNRYVGEQFLDNTSSNDRKLDDFTVTDFRLNYNIKLKEGRAIELSYQLANVLDQLYAPNGYTFSGLSGGTRLNFNYLYPQAGRNSMFMLRLTI